VCICSIALDIRDAILSFQFRIIMSPAAGMDLTYFLTLSHKRHDFPENVIQHEKVFYV